MDCQHFSIWGVTLNSATDGFYAEQNKTYKIKLSRIVYARKVELVAFSEKKGQW